MLIMAPHHFLIELNSVSFFVNIFFFPLDGYYLNVTSWERKIGSVPGQVYFHTSLLLEYLPIFFLFSRYKLFQPV